MNCKNRSLLAIKPRFEQLEERNLLSYVALLDDIDTINAGTGLPPSVESAYGSDGSIVRVVKSLSPSQLNIAVIKGESKKDLTPTGVSPTNLISADQLADGRGIGEVLIGGQISIATWTSGTPATKVPFNVPQAKSWRPYSRGVGVSADSAIYAIVEANFDVAPTTRYFWVVSDGTAVATQLNTSSGEQPHIVGISRTGQPLVRINNTQGNTKEIRLYASTLDSYSVFAAPDDGFSNIHSVTMSKDGRFVGFTASNSTGKSAIYVSYLSPSAKPTRVAGEPSDQELDSTESWLDMTLYGEVPPSVPENIDFAIGAYYANHVAIDRGSLQLGSVQDVDGRKTLQVDYFANGSNASNPPSLFSFDVQIDDSDESEILLQVGAPSILLTSKSSTLKTSQGEKVINSASLADINPAGKILVNVELSDKSKVVVEIERAQRPLLVVPGIVGSFPESNILDWILNVGADPMNLSIDPVSFAYHGMYESFINAGYVLNKDLYLAVYDWRLPPGPLDGNNDGIVSLLDPNQALEMRRYGTDYLIYWMNKASEDWEIAHPGHKLDTVDIVAHSTGGLLTRSYAQSPAYGATLTNNKKLPKINTFVLADVPLEGAPKAISFLNDNWLVDPSEPTYRFFLRSIANTAFQKILDGDFVGFPGVNGVERLSLEYFLDGSGFTVPEFLDQVDDSNYNPAVSEIKQKFIDKYISQIRGLAATYVMIGAEGNWTDASSFANGKFANYFLEDLNARGDWIGDSQAGTKNGLLYQFPIQMFGNGVDTIVALEPSVGTASNSEILQSIDEFADRAEPGQPYLGLRESDCSQEESLSLSSNLLHEHPFSCGDGTVPRVSLVSRLGEDARVGHAEYMNDVSQFLRVPWHVQVNSGDVSHVGILNNAQVISDITAWLGAPLFEDNVGDSPWLSLPRTIGSVLGTEIVIGIDPVTATLVDELGNRTGLTESGVTKDIPNSNYIGEKDGFLIVVDPDGTKSYQLELIGDGGPYFVDISGKSSGKSLELKLAGSLVAGQKLLFDIPKPSSNNDPVAADETVFLSIGETVKLSILANDWISPGANHGLQIQIVDPPQFSQVSIDNTTNSVFVTVDANVTDSFTYMVIDGFGNASNVATVQIKSASSIPPSAVGDQFVVTTDFPTKTVDLLANDRLNGNEPNDLTISLAVNAPNNFQVQQNNQLEYILTAGIAGIQRTAYQIDSVNDLRSNVAAIEVFIVDYSRARPWNNPKLAIDTNDNGTITPSDALLVINYLISGRDRLLPMSGATDVFGYLDVSADGRISPSDALLVINFLIGQSSEGELPSFITSPIPLPTRNPLHDQWYDEILLEFEFKKRSVIR